MKECVEYYCIYIKMKARQIIFYACLHMLKLVVKVRELFFSKQDCIDI